MFLCSGKTSDVKGWYVNQNQVCRPKKQGGLGFRDIKKWNTAAVGNLVWHIGTNKDDLWVKWMHTIYMKQQNWWDYTAPPGASWVVRKLCKVTEELKRLHIHTWDTNSQYKINNMYKMMTDEYMCVPREKVIWNRISIPKHKFILWLGVQDRLQTKGRLHNFEVCPDDRCCIYGQEAETIKHLFFECSYSTQILHVLIRWIGINLRRRSLAQWIMWAPDHTKALKPENKC